MTAGLFETVHNRIDGLDVAGLRAAADGIGQHFFGQAAVIIGAAGGDDQLFEGTHVGERLAGDQFA